MVSLRWVWRSRRQAKRLPIYKIMRHVEEYRDTVDAGFGRECEEAYLRVFPDCSCDLILVLAALEGDERPEERLLSRVFTSELRFGFDSVADLLKHMEMKLPLRGHPELN